MAKLIIPNEWWTAPAQSHNNDNTIIVTGRRDMDHIISLGKFNFRIEISWKYSPDEHGMPLLKESQLMEQVTDAILNAFNSDPVAILTGIYTGDGERTLSIYTRSLHIFQRKINDILAPFPTIPISFTAFNDPDWEEYREMRETEIPDE